LSEWAKSVLGGIGEIGRIPGVENEEDPPGWSFSSEEVSAGVYRLRGVDSAGRSVEATGTDYDELLTRLKRQAAEIGQPD
jgi:hypothetical protein